MDRDKMSNQKKDINMCIQCTLKQRIDESSNTVEREAIETLLSIGNVHGRQTPSDGKSSHCLWQGELKITFINHG
jgi:hypothetical protein